MRGSLDHCVKCTICETQCPVSNVTPLFPGPKYAGPQAERYRDRRRAVGRRLGRLLLGVRDLLDVLPAGGEDRRDQLPGAQQAQAAEGHPAPRPDHHPPDLARPRGHAGRAARQLHDRFSAGPDPRREAAQDSPRRAPRRSSPAGGSRAGFKQHPSPAHRARRSSISTAAAPSTTSRGRARRSSRSSSTTASRSSCPSRTAAGCRCSRAGCSTTRARSCSGSARALAPVRARRPGHDHRRQRHELHADAQARGARDPVARGRPRSEARVRAHLRHLRAAARAARPRRAQDRLQARQRAHRLPRAVPAAGPLDRQAGARAARADPGPRGHRGERALLRDRGHLRAEGREVRHRDGGRARPVRPGRGVRGRRRRVRQRDVPLADQPRHRAASRCTRSTTCTAPTGSEG